jgi:hypothetical protein
VEDGRQTDDEEAHEDDGDGDDQSDDRDGLGGTPAANAQAHDPLDGRHEDDGEESADVDDLKDLAKVPGESESQEHGEDEDDVTSDGDIVAAVALELFDRQDGFFFQQGSGSGCGFLVR